MKHLILLSVFLFTTNLFSQVPTYVPKNELKNWWGFNGNANDESGNGNNGVVNGPILASDRFGKVNSSYFFKGNEDIISTTNQQRMDIPFTVSFWVQLDSISQAWLIMQGGDQSGFSYSFDLGVQLFPDATISQYIFTGGENWIGNDTLKAGSNKWYNIVYGQSDKGTKLYVNSVLVATNNEILTNQGLNGYWRFGGCSHPGQASLFGRIDDIGIWGRELNQSEVLDLFYSSSSTNITENNTSSQFLIYPNPTNSYVIIDCGYQTEVSAYSFVITNSLSQEKVSSKFTSRYQQIDISGIGGVGLYIISIRDNNNNVIETRKLLIQ